MIDPGTLVPAGTFGQPHGLNGELQASFSVEIDPDALDCLIVEIDGLPVPFFVNSVRPKGSDTLLLTIDGIVTKERARALTGHQIMLHRDDPALTEYNDDSAKDDDNGFYIDDLIDYKAIDRSGTYIGTITDYDDSTDNLLFIVSRPGHSTQSLIPAVPEFIIDINPDTRIITLELPDGLL